MPNSFDDLKRIRAFKRDLVAAVPRFPNNKASRDAIEAKSLTDLLITFISWRLRHVGTRSRQVTGRNILDNDFRAEALRPNIHAFLNIVEKGEDLTLYLSEGRKDGYTPAAEISRQVGGDSWADKDFLLNVKARTDELAFWYA